MLLLCFLICFFASVIGAICGIGGGVIIKPVLDAFQVMDVASLSFLSGCTVLSMTTYSVIKSKLSGKSNLDQKVTLPLAIGSIIGGILGKWFFQMLALLFQDLDKVGMLQSSLLCVVTVGTVVYTLRKNQIRTHQFSNPVFSIIIGVLLGVLSSFLGIGGGPINLVVLYFFFSMDTKKAVENSLYTIFYSQIASIISSIVTKQVPDFSIEVLVFMVVGGICGGICGRSLNKKMSEQMVEKLFLYLMYSMIVLNVWNVYQFMTGK